MTDDNGTPHDTHHVYIDEVHGHQQRYQRVVRFTRSSTKAAGIMLLAAIVALVVANTPAYGTFYEFWHTHIAVGFGTFVAEMSLAHIVNDVFMAVFFLLVGLEIKYEMTAGELVDIRQAVLPIVAAAGGVLAPIGIYLALNAGSSATLQGWGVPTATDIAFALGILALLGNRVPNGLRVFLSTLAVADDIIAIIVIAVFYGHAPSFGWLAAAAVVFVALVVLNRAHVYALAPYLLLGCVLWLCVFMSGVHATIAGVLLAFAIPGTSRVNLRAFLDWSDASIAKARALYDDESPVVAQDEYLKTVRGVARVSHQVVPPATRLEHRLYPWVYFAVLPLFALSNADVSLVGEDIASMMTSPVFMGVFFGLLIGKPVGIMLFSAIVVKLKISTLPEHVNWTHMLGAAILAGVGFTMAIFVANLAYADAAFVSQAKLGILTASFVAGVLGFMFLYLQARSDERRGVAYLTMQGADTHRQTAGAEAAHDSERFAEELGDAALAEQLAFVRRSEEGVAEIVVERQHDE